MHFTVFNAFQCIWRFFVIFTAQTHRFVQNTHLRSNAGSHEHSKTAKSFKIQHSGELKWILERVLYFRVVVGGPGQLQKYGAWYTTKSRIIFLV